MFGFKGNSKEPLHEFWHEYSVKEINKTKRKKCRDCPYRGVLSSSVGDGTTICCDYLLITGQVRGCRPEVCEHNLDMNVERNNTFTYYGPRKKEQAYN